MWGLNELILIKNLKQCGTGTERWLFVRKRQVLLRESPESPGRGFPSRPRAGGCTAHPALGCPQGRGWCLRGTALNAVPLQTLTSVPPPDCHYLLKKKRLAFSPVLREENYVKFKALLVAFLSPPRPTSPPRSPVLGAISYGFLWGIVSWASDVPTLALFPSAPHVPP